MEVREVPTPAPAEGEVRLRIEANAVCGTDLRVFTYGQKNVVPPRIIGHEICGIVDAVGRGVSGISKGVRVTVVTCIGCGRCEYCRRSYYNLCPTFRALGYDFDGAYAEYMIVPRPAVEQGNIIEAPEDLSFEEVALVEPFSCCINGAEYVNLQPGEEQAIFGSGPIGLMHTEIARARGARRVILVDPAPERLEIAKSFDADVVIDASKEDPVERILSLTHGVGVDVVVVACPVNEVQENSLKIIKKRGRISFFAGLPKDRPTITLDSNKLHYWEAAIFGAFASHKAQYESALRLAATGKVDLKKFVTHSVSLDEIHKGFDLVRRKEGLKVVVKP